MTNQGEDRTKREPSAIMKLKFTYRNDVLNMVMVIPSREYKDLLLTGYQVLILLQLYVVYRTRALRYCD